jgi:hypothetical protein
MKSIAANKNEMLEKERNATISDFQKWYAERMERFMAVVGLSYVLK